MKTRRQFIQDIVRQAGTAVKNAVPSHGVVDKAGRGNFLTAADLASEKIIMDGIKANFPDDDILSEETESDITDFLSREHLWVVDPIDGTNNFRYQRNYSCISIGYAEKGVMKLGAIYDPFHDYLFFAEQGKGATWDGQKIHVSDQQDPSKAFVATDISYSPDETRKNLELLLKFPVTPWVQVKGSAALMMCEVASGRDDIYFHISTRPWDNAAGFLIVEEAGGVVKDHKGNDITFMSPEFVMGNKPLVEKVIEIFSTKK